MSDIVARLRAPYRWLTESQGGEYDPVIDDAPFEAADEIERLTAELSIAYEAQGEMAKREDEVAAVIGAEYLLDPPDGGDVSLAEGVGRIKAERDALRAELAAEREKFEALHAAWMKERNKPVQFVGTAVNEFCVSARELQLRDHAEKITDEIIKANARIMELERIEEVYRNRKPIVYSPDAQAMSDRVKAAEAERDELRALLREANGYLDDIDGIGPLDLQSRIDAALKGDDRAGRP